MRLAALAVVGLAACSQAPPNSPQPDPEVTSVLVVIDRCFEGMAEHDSTKLTETVLPEAVITRVRRRDNGTVDAYHTSGADFIREISMPGPAYVERIWDPEVMVGDGVASVRAPYDFRVDTTYSHCGVDHFTLVKLDGGWKIQGIAYTQLPKAECRPSSPY